MGCEGMKKNNNFFLLTHEQALKSLVEDPTFPFLKIPPKHLSSLGCQLSPARLAVNKNRKETFAVIILRRGLVWLHLE